MKPYVVCHIMGSLDGRIMSGNWGMGNLSPMFEVPASKIRADAWLVGRRTMEEFSSHRPRRKLAGPFRIPKTDFVGHKAKTYAVAIDPSGKCRWDSNMVSTEHVIEVLTEKVPVEYLAHLRSKKVSYVFGGKSSLNLRLVLEKLNRMFGIKRVRIDGGGTVNGSFLKANLIDELSLVLAPVADGRMGIPTVFDADGPGTKRKGTRFRLKSVKRLERDFLWLRYAKA